MQQFAEDARRRVQVRRDDESADRLLAEPARRAPVARRVRGARSGRSEAHGRMEGLCAGIAPDRRTRPSARTRSISAAAASPRLPSIPREDSASACCRSGTSTTCGPDRCATAGTARCTQVRQRKITAPTKCTACELKAMCGMCPANGELENGDPEAPVDFLCRVAHLRAYAFDIPVAPHGSCRSCEGGVGYGRNDDIGRQAQTDHAGRSTRFDRPRLLPMLGGRPRRADAAAAVDAHRAGPMADSGGHD